MKSISTSPMTRSWLWLAVLALAIAGLFSLPPVIFRGPFFADKLPVELIFDTSLVIHVDMSVLVWMFSIGGLLWSLLIGQRYPGVQKTSVIVTALGMALIALSPFFGDPSPLKNNYVPVLQTLPFFLGLALFASGILLSAGMAALSWVDAKTSLIYFGAYIAAIVTLVSAVCYMLSGHLVPDFHTLDAQHYYELLFWGGGHIMQFTFTSLLLAAWLWLARDAGLHIPLPGKALAVVLAMNLVFVLPTPLIYRHGDLDEIVGLFTTHMRHHGGVSPLILGIAILVSALFKRDHPSQASFAAQSCLFLSILLFGYGGVLAFMISGANVTIPAHYHGSIVGITLAFMGLCYHLFPRLGYMRPGGKMASAQPYIYGIGQFCHITGLAIMGGYGALRKAPGSSQTIHTVTGKAMFFSGGALAITGGLLFVIAALRILLAGREKA